MKNNKNRDLLITLVSYLACIGIGFASCFYINNNYLLQVLVFTVTATVVIYIISIFLKNASLYDPYWSIIPPIVALYLFIKIGNYSWENIVLLVSLWLWGIRLTINWIIIFSGFDSYIDWRYVMLTKDKPVIVKQLINLFGIMMFPTLMVYIAFVPLIFIFIYPSKEIAVIGGILVFIGFLLELISDHQMRSYLRSTKERKVCTKGLWNYSRHPNYLGENLVWIGISVAMLLTTTDYWYYSFGGLAMLLMFLLITMPMMEKRQKQRREDYKEYMRTTSYFLILPHLKRKF